jgi:hypothetical protein
LISVNVVFILMAFKLHTIGSFNLLILIFGLATILTYFLHTYSIRKKRQKLAA